MLTPLLSERGAPRSLRSDNGPEFVSKAIREWLEIAGVQTAPIDPRKPWQNGADESFNGRFRDECLSLEWFRSRREAKVVIEIWRQQYNAIRPHSSLDYLTPIEFIRAPPKEEGLKARRLQNGLPEWRLAGLPLSQD